MTFVFQRVHSVIVLVETGEESQGRILHIIIGPLVIMSLSSFQIDKDAFPDEWLSCEERDEKHSSLWITCVRIFFFNFYLFMIVTHREREREAEA